MTAYFYGITDKGNRRERNEDTFLVNELFHKEYVLSCVIDGVGGYSGGDVAAGIARDVIAKHFEKKPADVVSTLKDAIAAANASINAGKQIGSDNQQMACVLTCAVVHLPANKFYYAHVGDTRLYLFRDKSLVKVSKDHSVVGYLEESGRLSEEDAMSHPRRNEINKALGFEAQLPDDYIDSGESPFLPGDMILLCSDGLSDMLSSQMISGILNSKSSIREKSEELIRAANDAGGNDNITVVLVANNKQPKKQVPVVPLERDKKIAPVKAGNDPVSAIDPVKKSRLPLILFIVVGASVLLGMLTPLFRNMLAQGISGNEPGDTLVIKPKNDLIVKLAAAANDTTRIFALPAINLLMDQSVLINKDTFYLDGNGATFLPDSSFRKPALVINGSSKAIILDSIIFRDFDVAIVASNNNVVLKNVRFINCRVPIQYNLSFRDSVVSGKFKDSIFK